MDLSEQSADYLEGLIPGLAEGAFKQAYMHALASGQNVVACEDEKLVEVHPDGTKKIIKKMPSRIKVQIGQRIEF